MPTRARWLHWFALCVACAAAWPAMAADCAHEADRVTVRGKASKTIMRRADGTPFEVWTLRLSRPICVMRSGTPAPGSRVDRLQIDSSPAPPAGVPLELTGWVLLDNHTQYYLSPDLLQVISGRRLDTGQNIAFEPLGPPAGITDAPRHDAATIGAGDSPMALGALAAGVAVVAALRLLARSGQSRSSSAASGGLPRGGAAPSTRAAPATPTRINTIARWGIKYLAPDGSETSRVIQIFRVTPLLLQVDAWCELRGAERTFRVDRIRHAVDLDTGEILDPVAWTAAYRPTRRRRPRS